MQPVSPGDHRRRRGATDDARRKDNRMPLEPRDELHFGGRGVYFRDPSGHLLEIITRPYGSWDDVK